MSNQIVSNADLHTLADALIKLFEGSPQETTVLLATQLLLLDGHPVAPAQIAARLQLPQETVTALLHQFGVEWDADGNVVGFGLSLTPTPHGAKEVEPSTAVVSWMPGTESLANIRANFCNFTNFFTSVETAAQYVAQHPGLAIVPVDAVFQIGKLLWEREPIKSLIAELAQRQR